MNPYSHALVKEVAAQRAGFEPSPVWGRLTDSKKLKAPREHYEHIMNMPGPHHRFPGPAMDDVMNHTKRIKKNVSGTSHINKENLQGI